MLLQRAKRWAYGALVPLPHLILCISPEFPAASASILALLHLYIIQSAASLSEWSSVMPLAFLHMVVAPWVLNVQGKSWLAAACLTFPVYAATEWAVQATHSNTAPVGLSSHACGLLLNLAVHTLGLMVTNLSLDDLADCLVQASAGPAAALTGANPVSETGPVHNTWSHRGASECGVWAISRHLLWAVDTLQLQPCARAQLLRGCRLAASCLVQCHPRWAQQLHQAILQPSSRSKIGMWATNLMLILQALFLAPSIATGTCGPGTSLGHIIALLTTFHLNRLGSTAEVVYQPFIKLREPSMMTQDEHDADSWRLFASTATAANNQIAEIAEIETLRANSVALVHELVMAQERAQTLGDEIKGLKIQQQVLSETNSQLEAERAVLLNQREELVVENLTLAAENQELGAVLDVLEAGEQLLSPVSPADTILDITNKLMNGQLPSREQVLLVKSAVTRNSDIYQPFNLGGTLQEMKMDHDVEQALMLQLGHRFPDARFESDTSEPEVAAPSNLAKRRPISRQRSTVLGFPDLRTALAAIAVDAEDGDLEFSNSISETAPSLFGISSPVLADIPRFAASAEDGVVSLNGGISPPTSATTTLAPKDSQKPARQRSTMVLSPVKLSRKMIKRAASVLSFQTLAPTLSTERISATCSKPASGHDRQLAKTTSVSLTRILTPPHTPAPGPFTQRSVQIIQPASVEPQRSVPTEQHKPGAIDGPSCAIGTAGMPSWPAPLDVRSSSLNPSVPSARKTSCSSNDESCIETVVTGSFKLMPPDDKPAFQTVFSATGKGMSAQAGSALNPSFDNGTPSGVMGHTARVLGNSPSTKACTLPTVNEKLSSVADVLYFNEATRNSDIEHKRAPVTLEQGTAQPGMMLLDQTERCLSKSDLDFHFDSWELARVTGGRPLSSLAYFLLQRGGLITKFKLNAVKLVHFLQQVESGYRPNPYHNSTHAADVLQTFHVTLHRSGMVPHYVDPLTLLACYLSAIIHDFEHGGLTNDFLIQTSDALAIRYNDRAPLENHHLAAAFGALKMSRNNFLNGLCKQDFETLRKTIIELVLATDMKQHFSMLGHYKRELVERCGTLVRKTVDGRADLSSVQSPVDADRGSWECRHLLRTNDAIAEALQPSQESERMLSIQMAFKCSDLGHIAESRDVHLKWVAALEEEFFRQGDAERAAGLPISPLFDRNKPGVTKSQVGFLEVVALPLFKLFVSSFPGAKPLLAGLVDNYQWWRKALDEQKRASLEVAMDT